MDIPTLCAEAINPGLNNYVERSVVYTFNKLSAYEVTDAHYIFRFPYSANTFWTNYKYVIHSPDKSLYNPLNIGVRAKLDDAEQAHIISPTMECDANKWYHTYWAIPSIKTTHNNYIYFEVSKSPYEFRISLLGFTDLYPKLPSYWLMNALHNWKDESIYYKQVYIIENDKITLADSDCEHPGTMLGDPDFFIKPIRHLLNPQ